MTIAPSAVADATTATAGEHLHSPMPPAVAPSGVDSGFEGRLIDGITPIAQFFLASALHHLFASGVFDRLAGSPAPMTIAGLAEPLGLDHRRLRGFLFYLANENVVAIRGETVRLTAKGLAYGEFMPWYTLMIGGYATTLEQLGDALRNGAPPCTRNGREVGLGSCEMSRFDGMPMTRTLLATAGMEPRTVLDLGCGNGLYLVDFCRQMPGVTAWGAEPDRGGYEEAKALIADARMADRIRVSNASALEFLAAPPRGCDPDLALFGFVLHEILEQDGEGAVIELLRSTAARFPRINIAVIEVADEIRNPSVMRHGLARNFWNPYYLLHYFTNQRLESRAFWERLFRKAGLEVRQRVTTPTAVDSTGLELGYLLGAARAGRS